MLAAVRHARSFGHCNFTIVSHSFELLSRDRRLINHVVKQRFERLCAGLENMNGVKTATYVRNPPSESDLPPDAPVLPLNLLRSGLRLAKQAAANALYGAR